MTQQNYTGRRVIVTGGAGFVGSHLCRRLLDLGNAVICIDNLVGTQGSTRNINDLLKRNNFQLIAEPYETWAAEASPEAYSDVDCIFHQAASKMTVCMVDPEKDLTVNALGTLRLLRFLTNAGIRKIVHASTGSVYGGRVQKQDENHPNKPASFYGISKFAGESYCRVFGDLFDVDYTIFRYFHVIGPGQDDSDNGGVVPIFIRQMLRKKPLTIFGTGEQIRSFTSVADVVEANILAAIHPGAKKETYNCASGIQVSIQQLADFVIEAMGGNNTIQYEDWRPGDVKYFDVDNSKIRGLGMTFETNWKDVVGGVIRWQQQNPIQR